MITTNYNTNYNHPNTVYSLVSFRMNNITVGLTKHSTIKVINLLLL